MYLGQGVIARNGHVFIYLALFNQLLRGHTPPPPQQIVD
jgi:hypothetical protein